MSVQEKLQAQFPGTVYAPLVPPTQHLAFNYQGFHPGEIQQLPRGHVKRPGFQAFPVDVTWERDQAIPMRDGIKLYGDVFRPADGAKVPAIIPWSPYGKASTGSLTYEIMGPFHIGIPHERLSGYETFEGPNPADWCARGYAVVDIDARGCGHSEGDIMFWGEQEAVDIYDSITWIAKQDWCNGSVVMIGNSWLAISQINFACRFTHPNLKAIAPWEGLNCVYSQQICRGGIPRHGFGELIIRGFSGFNRAENLGANLSKHLLFDDYWKEKYIAVENIRDIPMYLTASYSTGLHCEGSFRTFEQAKTSRKWLRVHASQEWHDLYRPEAVDDLQRFYDFYAKGVSNGWEEDTPRVRLTLLGYEGSQAQTIEERPEEQWPPASQRYERMYLNAVSKILEPGVPVKTANVAHEGHSLTDSSDFVMYFDKKTEICGRPFVKLYMSCDASDEMDVVVQIGKVSSSGELLESLNWSPMPELAHKVPNVNVAKHLGQQGMLRASHHVSLRPRQSEDEFPIYDHDRRQSIPAGKIVPLYIPIWPVGVVFEAGEGLMLRVSGHDMSLPEVEMLRLKEPVDENRGLHYVYTGGDYQSYLSLPIIGA